MLSTLDGRSAPGWRSELGIGSFGRTRLDVSFGHAPEGGGHQYAAVTLFDERGWRDHSPGRLANLLAKFGHGDGPDSWHVSVLAARSDLVGNGLVPEATLAADGTRTPELQAARRETVYTHPDRTRNTLGQAAFNWGSRVQAQSRLQALAYLRVSRRETVNGDASDEPGVIASLNETTTRQSAAGAAVSLASRSAAHQWQIGASLDASRLRYRQTERDAAFDATRGVVPDANAQKQPSAEVEGSASALGVYATDTWQVAGRTHLTLTARANRARVSNELATANDITGELEDKPRETFTYTSLNPAIGVAHGLSDSWRVYANVARNTRVPTVIELGCADPNEPCRLPAGLQSDPRLEQVRSTSTEIGARWNPAPRHRVEISLYRSDNRNDIVFGSISTTGQLGYFRNFERTRHQGADLAWQASGASWELLASAGMLDATYQASGTLRMGERNVQVEPGTRMAGLPRSTFKLGGDWRFAALWSAGADLQWYGKRVVQGNEDGRIEDGGDEVDVSLPAYGVCTCAWPGAPRAAWS